MEHPYKKLNRNKFWESTNGNDIDLGEAKFFISTSDKIISAGSCFASNIISYLESYGLEYLKTEKRPFGLADLLDNYFYDTYSARYGNIYNPRQLLQLIQRATGEIKPIERFWIQGNKFIDPFRPGLKFKPESESEFELETKSHLSKIRFLISEANVFIFTSGLTEIWFNAKDKLVYPACPGTIAGEFDPSIHIFHSLNSNEIFEDLVKCREEIMKINPKIKFIFSVSPVPMIATASNKTILVANALSKANLLDATIRMCEEFQNCEYFPAYEIVFSNTSKLAVFEPDGRTVKKLVIDRVMDQFFKFFGLGHLKTTVINIHKKHEVNVAEIIQRECEEQQLAK
jgi:hypothetical protein